jgi:hypothetical protein
VEIESLCPFPVATVIWEPKPGEWSLTVCVKATFALVHGRTAEIAPQQVPLCDDLYWDGSPNASLYAPSDFAPMKARADVLLVGHAYAKGGVPVEQLTARMRVGGVTKALHIAGDRVWVGAREDLRPGPAAPFVKMPLRLERAAKGPANGIGIEASPHRVLPGWPVPNIRVADELGATGGLGAGGGGAMGGSDRDRTPSFGPIPAAWRAHAHLLSEASARWAFHLRKPVGPAPAGFDFGFFNAAPPEQQLDSLPSALEISLENLSPTHPRLEARLPVIQPRVFRVSPRTGLSYEVPLRIDTVWIDSDRSLAVIAWRGAGMIPSADEQAIGKLVVTSDKHPEPLVSVPSAASGSGGAADATSGGRSSPAPHPTEVTLSVAQSLVRPPSARPLPAGWTAPDPSAVEARSSGQSGGSLEGLPFRKVAAPRVDAGVRKPDPDEVTRTFTPSEARSAKDALPFRAPALGEAPPAPPPAQARSLDPAAPKAAPAVRWNDDGSNTVPLGMRSPVQLPPLPFKMPGAQGAAPSPPPPSGSPAAPPPIVPPISQESGFGGEGGGEPGRSSDAPPPVFSAGTIERPPLVGSTSAPQPPPLSPAPPPEAPPVGNPDKPAPAPAPDAPSAAASTLSIERCAIISAELGDRRTPRADVLRAHSLTEAAWAAVDRHWMAAIAKETERGASELLSVFDAAYVTAVERLRGAITPEEYARLTVGVERGNVRPVLAELQIQRPALMRIQRVWQKRLADDQELAARVSDALDAERKRTS